MLTTIRGPESTVIVDLKANPEWVLSELRRHGQTTVFVDRNTVAWRPEIVNENGGFYVEVVTPFGNFRGVADIPEPSEAGANIKIRSMSNWLDIRLVGERSYYGLTPGAIFLEAVHQGIETAVPLTLGSAVQAPPIIPFYEFKRQSVLSVLNDMMNLCEQTWKIDDRNRISWLPRQGKYEELWIIDDGMFTDKIQTSTLGDTYAETIEEDRHGRTFSAFSHAPPLWPQQRVVKDASN